MIVLQLPKVERKNTHRPKQCTYCRGEILQRWGQVNKRVKDTKVRNAKVYRYWCVSCQRSFRHYPDGITRAMQSVRLEKLIVILWSLGLSYRSISYLLSAFGIACSRMSGWRDVQQAGERVRKQVGWKRARIVGVDGAWLNGKGIMVAVDMGDGQPLAIGQIDEKDSAAVHRWLKLLKQRHGIGAIVTDDLRLYRGVSEQLELGHQVCQFHVRRWVGKACRELIRELPEQWHWILEQVRTIVTDLPANGGRQLLELYKQVPGNLTRDRERTAVDRLRHLLIRLSESWERYTAFYHDPGIPWTNNRTEQAIGRMKMRAETVRGYKTSAGLLNALFVSSSNLS